VIAELGGEPVDTRFVAMRRDQFRIVDNWDTLGMRGTGSRRVVVEDLFIPEHHTVPSPNTSRPIVDFPGRGLHANPIFYGSLWPKLISELAAVSVGIARAAIDEYIENIATKRQWGPMSPMRSELPLFHGLLGEATAYVDTAEATLHQVAEIWTEQARRSMETGEPANDEDDRRLILVEQQIVQLASRAVETVFRTSGSSAANKGRRIERYFRDLSMVRTHVTLQFERTWENVGRLRLGLRPEMPL
jgi:3-hydroxy-9,10-secoandrosta-1,3,5(10)-triene-9,17-dione monooxygenase